MSSRIEQIIEEIEEYVESCKYQPLSTTKIIVNKEEIEELLRELRLKTPDEIKRYQKIISNKDAILQDAQSKADNIIEDTKKQVKEMVKESEVMQQAYAQANETINSANQHSFLGRPLHQKSSMRVLVKRSLCCWSRYGRTGQDRAEQGRAGASALSGSAGF